MVRAGWLRHRYAIPVVFVLVVWSLTTHGKFSVTGDEPHYLIISESLLVDRDLDIDNNYRQEHGRRFGAGGLTAGPHAERNRSGALWSVHDIGLPVILLPVYAAATRLATGMPNDILRRFRQDQGLFAYSIIGLALTLLTASGLGLLQAGLGRVAPDHAAVVTLVFGLSPPILSYAFLVFPETVAFVVTCSAVWLLCLRPEEITAPRVTLAAAALSLLPWLHRKYAPLELGLIAMIVWWHRPWFLRQSRTLIAVLAALALLPQAAMHVWTIANWGTLGGPQMLGGLPFTPHKFQVGALGLLMDRERGLLAYAPIYLMLPACWALSCRRNWLLLLLPVLLLFLPMAAYINWHGGFCPAARYIVPIMPLLVVPVARALQHSVVRWVALPLLVFQTAILAVVWSTPRTLWPKEQATNEALHKIPLIGPAYERWLPSLATGDAIVNGWITIASIVLATAAMLVAARGFSELPVTRRGR